MIENRSYFSQKLSQLYDPTQAALKPVMCRMLRTSRDEYLELDDANMIDWVTNYLFVNVHLIEDRSYDNALNKYILRNLDPLSSPIEESPIKQV